jgi:glutathione S-transferase
MRAEKSEGFKKVSPMGKTPVAVLESGLVLQENLAILSHIGARDFSKELTYKQGTEEYDKLNVMLSFLHSSLHPSWGSMFKAMKKLYPGHEEAFTQDGKNSVNGCLARLNEILKDKTYLTGDHKTIVDASFLAFTRWNALFNVADIPKEYPNVQRLINLLEEDPAVKFAHAIEDQKEGVQTTGGFVGHTSYDKIKIL